MDLDQLKKDLDTVKNMPDEEAKHISKDPEKAAMDIRFYQMSQERDGGKTWEKLKKVRQMFKDMQGE